ncbi:MAG TPA: alpha/beta fold hydrolase [Chloroflexota bacterium]|nr:alpha/beta fold hydrolase [Chloroflexota bacterium]
MLATWARTAATATLVVLLLTLWRGPALPASGAPGGQLPSAPSHGFFFTGEWPYSMYVEYEKPARPTHTVPVIMVHGSNQTGAEYWMTPDGRLGWAPYFLDKGWEVYTVDWPGQGRSPTPPDFATMPYDVLIDNLVELLQRVGPAVMITHSMSGTAGWPVAERAGDKLAALIAIAPGPPANMQPESSTLAQPEDGPQRCSGACLWDFYAVSDLFPKEAFGEWEKSSVSTSARMVNQRQNYQGTGPHVSGPEILANIPAIVVTGDMDPRHSREADAATAHWFGKEHVWLPDRGLPGHGHQMMIEHGNLQVADVLLDWLSRTGIE